MSAADSTATTKKFGKGERSVPHHSQKASKFYPAYDEKQPKKVRGMWELKRCARRDSRICVGISTNKMPDSQVDQANQVQRISATWRCSHPPRRSIPRQASRPPQATRPGHITSHRSIQDQWSTTEEGERKICHCYIYQGRPE